MTYQIDARHYDYESWAIKARKCRLFMAGEQEVKHAGEEYLPRLSGQSRSEYNAMQDRTLFYGASKRTKHALSGAIHRKDAIITIDNQYQNYLDDITLQETPFSIFAKGVTDEVLTVGSHVVCIDYDEVTGRPYARGYNREALINFRYTNYYGRTVLTLVVLEETHEVESDDDPFTTELRTVWRVKFLSDGVYQEQLWAKEGKGTDYYLIEEHTPTRNGTPLDFIPIVVLNSCGLGCNFEEAMFNDLVDVNRMHYLSSADIGTVLHFSALPTLTITGIDGRTIDDSLSADAIRLGSNNALLLPPGSTASILEFSGASATAIRQHLIDLDHRMSTLGARLLDPSTVSPATATAEIVKAASELTALRSLTQTLDAGLQKVLYYMIWWSGNDNPDVQVDLNKDFLSSKMTPSELTSLTDAYLKGGLSAEAYLHQLTAGEMLPANIDMDAEKKRLESKPDDSDGMRMRTERNQGDDTTVAPRANNL